MFSEETFQHIKEKKIFFFFAKPGSGLAQLPALSSHMGGTRHPPAGSQMHAGSPNNPGPFQEKEKHTMLINI